jgi:lipopolysaccharide/colanic/teichoic acid biosynthesis glycosyltransferase
MNNEKVTKIGYFLRKYKIDEILQFLNVIKGDMNIIGPRPWTEDFTKDYNLKNNIILNRTPIRPGITGYKQIEHNIVFNEDSDLYYIKKLNQQKNLKDIIIN